MERVFRSLKSEWLPKGGMVILAMRYAIETSGLMVITTFIDLTRTTMVYRLAYIKKSGNRLSRCPDFVINYNTQSLALKHAYEVYFGI